MKASLWKYGKTLATILVIAALAAAVTLPSLLANGSNSDTAVRNQEYVATRDDITVGIESSGLIQAGPNVHSFEEQTVVEDIFVKVGSEVKKGDPLASISLEKLDTLIQSTKDSLSDARASLLQASSSRNVLIAQNNKNKQDGLDSIHHSFSAKLSDLSEELSDIETVIAQHEQLLPELEQSVTELSAQVGDLQEEMKALETKIQENILEIGRLKEELLKLESQDSQNLNQEISTLQQQLQVFLLSVQNWKPWQRKTANKFRPWKRKSRNISSGFPFWKKQRAQKKFGSCKAVLPSAKIPSGSFPSLWRSPDWMRKFSKPRHNCSKQEPPWQQPKPARKDRKFACRF